MPWVEIVVGALLIAQAGAAVARLAALVMLVGVHRADRRLPRPRPASAVRCFGAWSAKPIGPAHLARNAVLIALAVLALF